MDIPDILKRRFHGSGLAGWLHLLYGHEEPKTTTKSDRDEQIEVQIRVSAARDPHNICYVGRHGHIQNLQLRRQRQGDVEAILQWTSRSCGPTVDLREPRGDRQEVQKYDKACSGKHRD
jgi:hypothetical protein